MQVSTVDAEFVDNQPACKFEFTVIFVKNSLVVDNAEDKNEMNILDSSFAELITFRALVVAICNWLKKKYNFERIS